MRTLFRRLALAAAVLSGAGIAHAAPEASPPVRLYVLNCGYIKVTDPKVVGFFGVTEADVDGKVDMPVPCYLVHHGADWLMFDAGNGDWRHGTPEETIFGMVYQTPKTVADQLKAIGITPDDIGYLAISHFHLDHVGNVALFPKAKLLVQKPELDATLADPLPFTPASAVLRLTKAGVVPLDGERDVFGDGTVVLEPTPGHTPGHQSLLVRLPRTGSVILTGDLYHYGAELKLHRVPPHEQATGTPESRARIEALAAREHARIWIEHDLATFNALKKAPAFYD